ncbi:hypothetical protein SAMN05660443_2045 [Marinospirillum celere]|uniref:Uncharacterized protein n=1 Tax=Marinospirillum celere TaxID=1122252 RepID=A0A1I1HUS5_9GAMM|nr:hypothetical protein SAMN05660443_2045 [Marinospirillum celere]
MNPAHQQGFLLLPLMILTLLVSLLIGLSARDLSTGYLTHRLQLYHSCQAHLDQLGSSNQELCPPCPDQAFCEP